MAYQYSFADNVTYGAPDVNKMVSRLVSSGVEDPFSEGVPYNLSKFNEAGALLYTAGAVPETADTLKVVQSGENKVRIYPGTAFFSDGSVIEIEAGGHELDVTAGVKNYVYLKNDLSTSNTSYPVCSTAAPNGDFVPLAEISDIGEITDKRTYARGKLPGYASNAQYTMEISDRFSMNVKDPVVKTYDIGNNSYRYLMGVTFGNNPVLSLYDIANDRYLSYAGSSAASRTDIFTLCRRYVDDARATVSISSGKLSLSIKYYSDSDNYDAEIYYTLYLF